jgi:hypothetical protein
MSMKGLLELLRDADEERWLMPLLSGGGDRAGYIAWLLARGEARGELMAALDRLSDGGLEREERDALRARAVELGATADRDWLLLMRRVHGPFGCGVGEEQEWPALERGCAQSWELLEEGEQTRMCATCAQRVYLCGTREEAVWRAEAGERVALGSRVLDAIMSEVEHEIEGYVVAKRTWWRRGVGSR